MCFILAIEQFSIKTKSRKDIHFKIYTKGKEKTEKGWGQMERGMESHGNGTKWNWGN